MKILGIDPGLAATGIGIVTGRGFDIQGCSYGSVNTASDLPQAERLARIYVRIHQVLQDESPDLMILEDVFSLDKYPKSGIVLGKVCGVILLAGHQQAVPLAEIPVREAKQVLTGNGNADKKQVEAAVRQMLKLKDPIRPFHASDALALAIIGLLRNELPGGRARIPSGGCKRGIP
ncbi:MAG: crossover junction endodeoxyribonuclease RuvC [Desulfobacterales bacterium]|jgi:crossover junction endodeoxyribonuclease RuvC